GSWFTVLVRDERTVIYWFRRSLRALRFHGVLAGDFMSEPFAIAKTAGGGEVLFRPAPANPRGLVTGATRARNTLPPQVLAALFSALAVRVFLAEVKGDLSGVAAAGASSATMKERLQRTGIAEPDWRADPVVFWDVFARHGFPLRATISDMGPLLLGRLF